MAPSRLCDLTPKSYGLQGLAALVSSRAAIDEIFTEDAVFYEPGAVHRGRDEIDRIAGVIRATNPPFRYTPPAPPPERPFPSSPPPHHLTPLPPSRAIPSHSTSELTPNTLS